MKKNLNVIHVKGIRGLLFLLAVASCLVAGFIVYPGWVAMHLWNAIVSLGGEYPLLGLGQGVLLWGIIIVSYLIFKKEKVVICFKTPNGLNEEELKAVFADIKKQTGDDKIIQAMMKAKETELKIKETETKNVEVVTSDETNNG